MEIKPSNIRNFCIIAHIDHGKSTLADRLLEYTNTIEKRDMKEQTLDSMELEKERGITIKLKPVRMEYKIDSEMYELNLIDTPGHVDFSYEVSRSLAACEGAILVVDATQGIQAQTVSNVYKAIDANLTIIPVLNKIDLPSSDVAKVTSDLVQTFGFSEDEILKVSAKTGEGVLDLISEIVNRIPAPKSNPNEPLRALIFDSFYDSYLGVVAVVKVVEGKISEEDVLKRKELKFFATNSVSVIEGLGVFKPARKSHNKLESGEVGYIVTGLKNISKVKVGDTLGLASDEKTESLPGYKEVKPFVFLSIYTVDNDKFPDLREALEKLSLSDSSISYEPENNMALGFGFRCGFLGLLHADVIQERLEREFNLDLISTTPSVEYQVTLTSGDEILVRTAYDMPDTTRISEIREPWILVTIVTPAQYNGVIIPLCEGRRGTMRKMDYPTPDRVIFEYEMPLVELISNFFDELKSITSGYASLDYEMLEYRPVRAVKVDVLVHGQVVQPLSFIVVRDNAEAVSRNLLKKLKDIIPRQQFQVSLQASINAKVIAREDISGFRKDVLAKMSGGHRERKDKLLDIQKKGKERMKKFGKVDIPQDAFRQILSL
ncbi:elongation factor 4 [bacterium]|nr:elongation factor 4 [bacterium]